MTILDWRDARHWGGRSRPCIHCGAGTPLLDDAQRPAHKTCVERVLDEMFPPNAPTPSGVGDTTTKETK